MAEKMKAGEKYLTLQIGELKIPFFPAKTKDGKKFYSASLVVWINEKKDSKGAKSDDEDI